MARCWRPWARGRLAARPAPPMTPELHVVFVAGQRGGPLARLLVLATKRVRIVKRSSAAVPAARGRRSSSCTDHTGSRDRTPASELSIARFTYARGQLALRAEPIGNWVS